MTPESNHLSTCRSIYDARSSTYDDSFHPAHAQNYIRWTAPQPGQHVLDLACGTGLVALPARKAVGPTGTLTAVDISTGMMDVGKQNAKAQGLDIQWIEWDISDLASLKESGQLREDGYDLITCAAALVLLEDPAKAVRQWTSLLTKGGRVITDVPTERSHRVGLAFEEVGKELGTPLASRRTWVQEQASLEEVFVEAGLEVERAWTAPGHYPSDVYEAAKSDELFDALLEKEFYAAFRDDSIRHQAKEVFGKKWAEKADGDGMVREDAEFYMVIGRKPS
ncbi:MAG: hypothetical protein M1817_002613 [Caeruleum heppii]|nr:MAG: hypothetical protein M1817_002613 [Caeruleum heppii]